MIRIAIKDSLLLKSPSKNKIWRSADSSDEIDSDYKLFDPKFKISEEDVKLVLDINGIELFDNKYSEMKEQSEWSNTLNELIWEYSRLPCAWSFKKQKNVANEKAVFGSCRAVKCDGSITIFTENNKSKMIIIIKNFNPKAKHIEKRYIRGSNKNKIIALLKQNKPLYVHSELSNEMMHEDDYNPAHLPNLSTLRKIKQRYNDENRRDIDPIRSLCIIKTESMYYKCLTDIGIDPFYCIFYTPEQAQWLRLATRNSRCIISIDSTGNCHSLLKSIEVGYCRI